MRKARTFCLILACAFVVAGVKGQQAAEPVERDSGVWKKFSPPGSGFTISMPGAPSQQTNSLDTKLGKLDNHMFSLSTSTAGYIVSYAEFPEVITDPDAIKRMLDGGRDQALSTSGAKLKSEKTIKLNEHPGREWSVEVPGSFVATARVYWVKRRLYQTIIVMMETKDSAPEVIKVHEQAIARFLDSFALVEERHL